MTAVATKSTEKVIQCGKATDCVEIVPKTVTKICKNKVKVQIRRSMANIYLDEMLQIILVMVFKASYHNQETIGNRTDSTSTSKWFMYGS